jgi:hypothetical protein
VCARVVEVRKNIEEYIVTILKDNNMDENEAAENMLIQEFTRIYEECLDYYHIKYLKKDEVNKYETWDLPESEEAFSRAKELFGIKAIIDKTYLVLENYKLYKKMKKVYFGILYSLHALILIITFYGIAFSKTTDSKMTTLLVWVAVIVLSVGFVIVIESTKSKLKKLFHQIKDNQEYFYVKEKDENLIK